jgi:glycosyltransferase involved in cell wall biosynthesis
VIPDAARRRRVLHLITRLDRGGSSDCTLFQAMGTARRGHAVVIASGPSAAASPLVARARRQPGVRFLTVPALLRPLSPWRDLRALAAVVRLLRRGRFDVIHLHTSKAGALGRAAARLAGMTDRVVHQPHGHLFYGYYGALGSGLVLALERRLAPWARLHLTLTDRGADEHLSRGIGRREQFRTLPSGVDFAPLRRAVRNRDALRARLGYAASDVVVATLCRFEPVKGPEVVLAAFAEAAATRPSLHLLLAGDGPMLGTLRRSADHLGIASRVRFETGWRAPSELLPAIDLFVLASRNEGMGRALVEAMAAGVPVIGAAVGGIPELLASGEAGRLVPPGDAAGFARVIAALADDASGRAALARRGRERSLAYGAGRMVHRLLRLYDDLAA